jgi:hypothetical protein
VGGPVDEVTVAFTLPVTLVSAGFEVLDPQNNVLQPLPVTDDDTVFRLQFDPPLAGGPVAVKYEVRAEDGHILSGNFVFDVDAQAASTAASSTATASTTAASPAASSTAASSTAASSTAAASPTAASPAASSTTEVLGAVDSAATVLDGVSTVPPPTDGGKSGNGVTIAIVIAVVLVAGGFIFARLRTSSAA